MNQATDTTASNKTVFDHGIFANKGICTSFLREFGVRRDWDRVTLAELRAMLRNYPDERLFAAAKAIVERDGDEFDRAEFECPIELADFAVNGAATTAENFTAVEPSDDVTDAVVKSEQSEQSEQAESGPQKPKRSKPAKPSAEAAPNDTPDVGEVAGLLAKLLAANKPPVDEDLVRRIAGEVSAEGDSKVVAATAQTLEKIYGDMEKLVKSAVENAEPREIRVVTERSEITVEGLQHREFETLLRMAGAVKPDGHRLNIWLYGPPGTGKTTAARNAAKALDLPFYCTGALLTKYDITGFIDAGGKLVRTPFREAWENGGVYLFDEIDGSAPAAVVAFNAALANGIMAFPDGMVARHKDCVVIAAANTTGLGATAEFTGRMKLDLATLDRFEMLEWAIDEKVEAALSTNKEWAKVVQKVRANVQAKGIKGVCITPRATISGCALLEAGLPMEKVKQSVLRKAMSAEQWAMVAA